MRIIVLANTMVLPRVVSGGDRLFIEISKELDKNKYEIRVVTTQLGYDLWKKSGSSAEFEMLPQSALDRHVVFALVPFIYLIRAFYGWRIVNRLSNQLLRSSNQPLIIYTSSDFMPDVLPATLMKIKNRNVLWVSRIYHIVANPYQRRGNLILNSISFLEQRMALWLIKSKSDLIITLTATYHELVEFGFLREKLAVSDGGIDLEHVNSLKPSKKEYDGVFLGRLHPTKGVYELIDIWKNVVKERKNAKLAIIGGGTEDIVNSLKKRILQSDLQSNIDLLGFIENPDEVYSILKSGKVFLDPEHENGWSLVTCEAMACKLPVVAYNIKIFGTAFKQGYISVPLHNTSEYAKAILYLLKNENERLKLAEKAYAEASKFDWKQTAKTFSHLININIS